MGCHVPGSPLRGHTENPTPFLPAPVIQITQGQPRAQHTYQNRSRQPAYLLTVPTGVTPRPCNQGTPSPAFQMPMPLCWHRHCQVPALENLFLRR